MEQLLNLINEISSNDEMELQLHLELLEIQMVQL